MRERSRRECKEVSNISSFSTKLQLFRPFIGNTRRQLNRPPVFRECEERREKKERKKNYRLLSVGRSEANKRKKKNYTLPLMRFAENFVRVKLFGAPVRVCVCVRACACGELRINALFHAALVRGPAPRVQRDRAGRSSVIVSQFYTGSTHVRRSRAPLCRVSRYRFEKKGVEFLRNCYF